MKSLLQRHAVRPASMRTYRSAGPPKQFKHAATARHIRLACRAIAQDSENGVKAAAAAKKAAVPSANRPFTNTQRFQVPQECARLFEEEWQRRAADMKNYDGFQGFSINREGAGTYVISSSWSSIPQWEAYNLGPEIRRSHLPYGIYQYVPAKGEGFPEDFVPFVDFIKAVDAKY